MRRIKSLLVLVALIAGSATVAAQYQITPGRFVQAWLQLTDYLILGTADTSGCRADLEAGDWAFREGDDSAYCNIKALAATFAGGVSGTNGLFSGNLQMGAGGSFSSTRFQLNTPSDGRLSWSNASAGNTYDEIFADWGTTLSPESVSVANDATLTLGTASLGQLVVTVGTTNTVCRFTLRGSSNAALLDDDGDTGGGAVCTITKDNASTLNVYFDTTGYFLQNKLGGTRAVRVALIGG